MNDDWPELGGKITGNCHILPIRIYYEDTDFSGFVYHANYLKFCERARSDFLRALGIHHHELHWHETDGSSGFVVRKMNCDFLRPARIDDVVVVKTSLKTARGARMEIDQSIWIDDICLFKADVTAALIDASGRPKRFSASMLKAFSKFTAP